MASRIDLQGASHAASLLSPLYFVICKIATLGRCCCRDLALFSMPFLPFFICWLGKAIHQPLIALLTYIFKISLPSFRRVDHLRSHKFGKDGGDDGDALVHAWQSWVSWSSKRLWWHWLWRKISRGSGRNWYQHAWMLCSRECRSSGYGRQWDRSMVQGPETFNVRHYGQHRSGHG